MGKGRRRSNIEGVAIHDGPESCVGVREGDGEALTGGVQAGLLSREIKEFGVPTLSMETEGNTTSSAIASCWWAPRGQRTMACTEPPCARTGRSRARPQG